MIKIETIFTLIKMPRKMIRVLGNKGVLNWLADKPYLKLVYRGETGKKLNIDKPQTFNEKLQWLKLYDRKPEYCKYVDKYTVRSHISETIGEEYLIPLIGVYDSVEEIDWDLLPNKFVLKCTHGSGANIICTDKNKLDIEASKLKLNKWMKKSWYWFGREWPYKNIKPRIICEEFISNKNNTPDDYKVLCFNGEAKLIQLHKDRYDNHKQDFYDINWNIVPMTQGYENSSQKSEKPIELEKMICFSEKLSKDIYHVRVDWYVVRDKLYFGEMTLFDGAGFTVFDNEEDNYLLGSWIRLPTDTFG